MEGHIQQVIPLSGMYYLARVGNEDDPLREEYMPGEPLDLDGEQFDVALMNCLIDPYYDGVELNLQLAFQVVSAMDQAAQMYHNLIYNHVLQGLIPDAKKMVKYLEGLRILQYYLAEKGREHTQQNAEDLDVEPEVLEIIRARFNEGRFTGPYQGTILSQAAPYSVYSMGLPGSEWNAGDVEVMIGEVEDLRQLFDMDTLPKLQEFIGDYQTRAEEIMIEVAPVHHPYAEAPEESADDLDFVGAG